MVEIDGLAMVVGSVVVSNKIYLSPNPQYL